jgi:hypothetical protein
VSARREGALPGGRSHAHPVDEHVRLGELGILDAELACIDEGLELRVDRDLLSGLHLHRLIERDEAVLQDPDEVLASDHPERSRAWQLAAGAAVDHQRARDIRRDHQATDRLQQPLHGGADLRSVLVVEPLRVFGEQLLVVIQGFVVTAQSIEANDNIRDVLAGWIRRA